jgi:putative protein kinase ArgK-like GTPase of G3E family
VNKADRPDAAHLHGELLSMLRAAHDDQTGHHDPAAAEETTEDLAPWLSRRPGTLIDPRTFLVSGEQGLGVTDLVDDLESLGAEFGTRWQAERRASVDQEVREAVIEEATRRLRDTLAHDSASRRVATDVLTGGVSVMEAATRLLEETAAVRKREDPPAG